MIYNQCPLAGKAGPTAWHEVYQCSIVARGLFSAFALLCFSHGFAQIKPKGMYVGLVPIQYNVSPDEPHRKWYHLSTMTFKGDSVFLEQSPVSIYKKDTVFSASDGGFYEYRGMLQTYKGKTFVEMNLVDCDYCAMQMVRFTPPEIIADGDSATANEADGLSHPSEPEEIENPALKYKTFLLEKTGQENSILVDKMIFRRRKNTPSRPVSHRIK